MGTGEESILYLGDIKARCGSVPPRLVRSVGWFGAGLL